MARALRAGAGPSGAGWTAAAAAATTAAGLAGTWVVVMHPSQMRLLFALLVFAALLCLLLARPQAGLVAVVGWLFVMALGRRLLIEPAGWTSYDPLLLVSPALAIVMVLKLFALDGRPLAPDRLSKWVLAVLAIALLQAVNPLAGSVAAGLGGFLFVGIPLLWFMVARELASDELIRRLGLLVLVLALGAGLYGLAQTEIGFLPWDRAWLDVNGYVSLNVGDTVRAFGTFSSSAEYALVLGAGVTTAVAMLLRGRMVALALPAVPLLGVALFLASGRSALILTVIAAVVVVALNTRRASTAAVIAAVALVAGFGGLAAFSGTLAKAGQGSGDLASHQLEGLSDPLNPDSSTLLLHFDMLIDGFEAGIQQPLGYGTGASNNGAAKLGGGEAAALPTEVDISNAFVSFGLLGGIAYLGVVVLLVRRVVRLALAGRLAALVVAGLLVVGLGQWLIGGNYGLCALIWICAGWLAQAEDPVKEDR